MRLIIAGPNSARGEAGRGVYEGDSEYDKHLPTDDGIICCDI
jgi:hypothetical protein